MRISVSYKILIVTCQLHDFIIVNCSHNNFSSPLLLSLTSKSLWSVIPLNSLFHFSDKHQIVWDRSHSLIKLSRPQFDHSQFTHVYHQWTNCWPTPILFTLVFFKCLPVSFYRRILSKNVGQTEQTKHFQCYCTSCTATKAVSNGNWINRWQINQVSHWSTCRLVNF